MSKPDDFYLSEVMKRRLGPQWHKQPGCKNLPMFDIPLDKVLFDELHLLLRIMDRLEYGLIMNALEKDEVNLVCVWILLLPVGWNTLTGQRLTLRKG